MHDKNLLKGLLVVAVVTTITSTAIAMAAVTSTCEDQLAVEVTVYNSDVALIKDRRVMPLPQGAGELRFMDVAAYIQPETVYTKSINHPMEFMVLEQNYEYDLMDYNKLLNKYVGKKLKLERYNAYQDRTEVVDATLLSNNNNQPVYQIGKEIYLGHEGIHILPEIPENLISKPTLMWMYKYGAKDKLELEVSYLTSRMSWKADYILVLNKDDTKGDLSGWVTINNRSGTIYKDAALKLVAGEVNRARRHEPRMMMAKGAFMEQDAADGFVEKGFFEYHIYDLQRTTTLKDKQIKQISLLEANDFSIQKEYRVYGERSYYTRQYRENNPKQPVNVHIKFKNAEENNLGMPLPKGIIRLYKRDDASKLQFIGEDNIEHTPKDEDVTLKVGEAFDVVAERKQIDYRQLTTRLHETEWEVTLKNHKEEDIVVTLIEPVYGNWRVTYNSHDYIKEDAFTLKFNVKVAKDEEVKVRYRLQVGLR